jgi:alpha-glucosidase (family GH31 glycosyl hydrolase)
MNSFQEVFNKQKAYFDSDATKSYEWRIDQLTRLENLCNENAEALEAAMSSDFKTASQEKVFEAGFDALTHAKSVLISPPDVAIEHLFPPYTEEKVKALSQWFEY